MRKHAIHFHADEGCAKQSFKDECDINLILKKFQKSGAISHYASNSMSYGDATQIQLQDALNVVANAETMFEELPSSIRKKFNNDPGQFLAFVQDEKNLEEMRELGLANKGPIKETTAEQSGDIKVSEKAEKEQGQKSESE